MINCRNTGARFTICAAIFVADAHATAVGPDLCPFPAELAENAHTENIEADDLNPWRQSVRTPDPYIRIEVFDDGDRAQVFDEFYVDVERPQNDDGPECSSE
ncbi:MAG: hypothetical protein AAGB02_09570 [Pseudomonadota bacterium]